MKKLLLGLLSLMLIVTACTNREEQKIDAIHEQISALYMDEQKSALQAILTVQDITSIREALKNVKDREFTERIGLELDRVEQVILIRDEIDRALPAERMYTAQDIEKIDAFLHALEQASPGPVAKMIIALEEQKAQVEQYLVFDKKLEQTLGSYAQVMKDGFKLIDEANTVLPVIAAETAKASLQKKLESLAFFVEAFAEVQDSTSLDFDYAGLSTADFSKLLDDIRTHDETLYQEMKPVFKATLDLAQVYRAGTVMEGTSAQDLLEIESTIATIRTAELRTSLKEKLDEVRGALEQAEPTQEPAKPQDSFYSEQNDEYVLKSIQEFAKQSYDSSQTLRLKVLDSTRTKITVQVYEELQESASLLATYEYDRVKKTVTDLSTGSSTVLPGN